MSQGTPDSSTKSTALSPVSAARYRQVTELIDSGYSLTKIGKILGSARDGSIPISRQRVWQLKAKNRDGILPDHPGPLGLPDQPGPLKASRILRHMGESLDAYKTYREGSSSYSEPANGYDLAASNWGPWVSLASTLDREGSPPRTLSHVRR